MKNAAITGSITALGTFLAVIAVYHDARLDWPETALVAGITLLTVGVLKIKDIVEETCGKE